MRTIVGAQRITAGSAKVFGHPAGAKSLRKYIGYVTQSPSIYPDLTTVENVRYFARLYGVGKGRVQEVIDAVGLTAKKSELAGNLSGGQKGRVSLACALVCDPDLLILDEPTVGLDPVLRAELWAQFAALAARGKTLLISSHAMDEANHCADLILMRDGAVLAHAAQPRSCAKRTPRISNRPSCLWSATTTRAATRRRTAPRPRRTRTRLTTRARIIRGVRTTRRRTAPRPRLLAPG